MSAPRYVTNDDLDNWFGYHPPSAPAIAEAHEFVRREALELATMFNALLPEGAEKTLALRKIREASMWANAAIACRQEIGERPWTARPVSITVTQATDHAFMTAFVDRLSDLIIAAARETFGEMDEGAAERFTAAVNQALVSANGGDDADTV